VLAKATPGSPAYGSGWLSNDEVHAAVAPSPEAVASVRAFAVGLGLDAVARTPNSDVMTISMPVAVAEKALGADYAVFEHGASKARLVRTLAYAVPPSIAGSVALVGPTNRFGLPFKATAVSPAALPVGNDPNVTVLNTPENLRALYEVGSTVGASGSANKQAVTAFLDQYFDQASEDAFFAKFYPLVRDQRPGGGHQCIPCVIGFWVASALSDQTKVHPLLPPLDGVLVLPLPPPPRPTQIPPSHGSDTPNSFVGYAIPGAPPGFEPFLDN